MNATDGSGAMFDGIAERYDLLNRVLSLGMDQSWRRKLARAVSGEKFLDVATGTADVAIHLVREHPGCSVVGLDPSPRMLDVARRKVGGLDIAFMTGDSQEIPFPSASFDGVTMAFGIRNVPDRPRALREMARVVKPGGKVAILELSEPRSPFARFHVRKVVPRIGGWLSSDREYAYLQASIARFPPPDEFAAMMTEARLSVEEVTPMTFGACCLFVGRV